MIFISSLISHHPSSKFRRRFTLIELLIVIAIIAILAGMLLPALGKVRETGKSALCRSNVKQLASAVISYSAGYNDWLPIIFDAGPKRLAIMPLQYFYQNSGLKQFNENDWRDSTVQQWKAGGSGVLHFCPSVDLNLWGHLVSLSWASSAYAMNSNAILSNSGAAKGGRLAVQLRPSATSMLAEAWGRWDIYEMIVFSSLVTESDVKSNRNYWQATRYAHNLSGNFAFMDGHCENVPLSSAPDNQGHTGVGLTWFSYGNNVNGRNLDGLPPQDFSTWRGL